MKTITLEQPYVYKEKNWFQAEIIFEDDVLFTVSGKELARRITAALNGAYNYGKYKGMVNTVAEIDEMVKIKK